MAKNALDHIAIIDKRNDAHFPLAFGVQERIGLPHFLDEFAPFFGGDAPRLVFRYVDDVGRRGCFIQLFGFLDGKLITPLLRP